MSVTRWSLVRVQLPHIPSSTTEIAMKQKELADRPNIMETAKGRYIQAPFGSIISIKRALERRAIKDRRNKPANVRGRKGE